MIKKLEKTFRHREILTVFRKQELVISAILQGIQSMKGQSVSISRPTAALNKTSMTLLNTTKLSSNKQLFHLHQLNGEIDMAHGATIRKFRYM